MPRLVALDVAILLPPAVSAVAEALNRRVRGEDDVTLGPASLPHVTLTQQFVAAGDLPRVRRAIGAVLDTQAPLPLRVTGGDRRGRTLWLGVERSPALLRLHERLMDALEAFERVDGTTAAFTGPAARDGDTDWVRRHRTAAAFTRFEPHVTVGHGDGAPSIAPMTFDAIEIAACHLGRFCTCREVLARWVLGSG